MLFVLPHALLVAATSSEPPSEGAPADVSVFMEEMSTLAQVKPIHVQLSCDCGATRCNCLKVCDCKLPAVSFLEIPTGEEAPRRRRHRSKAADGAACASWERAPGSSAWDALPSEQAGFSFLEEQAGAALAPGLNQPMECDCEKVKCSCLRKCECDSSTGAPVMSQQQTNLQLSHGLVNDGHASSAPAAGLPMAAMASNATAAVHLMAQPSTALPAKVEELSGPSAVLKQLEALAPSSQANGYYPEMGSMQTPKGLPNSVAAGAGALQPESDAKLSGTSGHVA